MWKRILMPLMLAVLLLSVGCAESTETVSSEGTFDDISSQDETSADRSSMDGSSEEISLIPPETYELPSGIVYRLAEGWAVSEQDLDEELLNASSADGQCSVTAYLTALPNTVGITESLLVNDAVQTLPESLAASGAEVVAIEAETLFFAGAEHPVLSLVTAKDGETVYQQQLYLLDGDKVLLLTVTAHEEDRRAELWSYFE